jgi:hypothetical protein
VDIDSSASFAAMNHLASSAFWRSYLELPLEVRDLANKNFALLKLNPKHPSLHFKKVGRFWSVRIGLHYRAVATEEGSDMRWHWIGTHREYEQKTR